MKAMVTGGNGFIGSNLTDMLVNQGYEVLVIDDLSSGKVENQNKQARYMYMDVYKALKMLEEKGPFEADVIFHLAAMPRIQPSFKDPVGTFDNNALRTMIVCEYAKKYNSRVVYAGSSTYYGGTSLNPYAFSKWVGEEICKFYGDLHGMNTSIARFFNVYGPRHLVEGPYSTVVGIFEKQYREGMDLTVTGNGEQRRDFTHVYDICSGLIKISKCENKGTVYNLGTGTNYSINELAHMFEDSRVQYIPKRPGEAKETRADISFTTEKTGWQPELKLEDYIKEFLNDIR